MFPLVKRWGVGALGGWTALAGLAAVAHAQMAAPSSPMFRVAPGMNMPQLPGRAPATPGMFANTITSTPTTPYTPPTSQAGYNSNSYGYSTYGDPYGGYLNGVAGVLT